jgi:uncharacterized repeat protein (TIGR01451 family)
MRPPQRPAASCPANTTLRDKEHAKRAARRRRRALPAVLIFAAVIAAVALPGSLATAAKKLVLSKALVPSAAQTVEAPARAAAPAQPTRANSLAPLPFFFQAAPPSLATFAADCTTPKSDWNLGEVVCVKVDGTVNASRVQLVNPYGYAVSRADIGFGPQQVTFTIPSSPTLTSEDITFDNRGTWRITLVDVPSAGALLSVPITVRDPQQVVSNLQVIKRLVGSAQAAAGTNVAVVVRVYNAGPDPAANVHFTDTPPANTTFQSLVQIGGPTFTCTTPAVNAFGLSECDRASLGKEEAADFTITYKVNTSVADEASLTATATATTDTFETTHDDNGSSDSLTAENPTPPACTISYAGNVTQPAATGQNGAVVNFDPPTVSAACGAVTTTPVSGSFFNIGTSVVTSTTAAGPSASFVVTVTDEEDPSVSCPQDIVVSESPAGSGTANVSFNPTASDNSGAANINCSPASGSAFPVGITQVTCTANDASGNTAECTFDVEVKEATCTFTQPLDIVEDADVAGTASSSCGANVTFDTPVATCPVVPPATEPPTSTVTCNHASGSFFPVGDTVVTCQSSPDGATTSFTVTVKDVTAPAPDLPSLPTITGECAATAGVPTTVIIRDAFGNPIGTKVVNELPTATDNCGGKILASTNDQRTYDEPGTYTVNWDYTDAGGNAATQTQTVVVTGPTGGLSISGPPVVTVHNPVGSTSCGILISDIGAQMNTTVGGSCGGYDLARTVSPAEPDNIYNVGTTYTVVSTVTDGTNTASVTQQLKIVDDTQPTISAPPDVTVNADPVSCSVPKASVALGNPVAAAHCGAPTVTNDAPASFPLGETTVTWTVTDTSGNAKTATQKVTVADVTPPVITLNGANPMSVILHSAYVEPGATATDNCAVSFAATPSGTVDVDTIGTYIVTYNASDPSGNPAASVTRTVKVIYDFSGFFSPVNNLPTINQVNGGRTVPVKFSLAGDQGLGIMAAGSPYSQQVSCSTSAPVADIEATETPGGSTLTYDASSGQYSYNWKTEKSWAGTCRVLTVALIDGTPHTAHFKFK